MRERMKEKKIKMFQHLRVQWPIRIKDHLRRRMYINIYTHCTWRRTERMNQKEEKPTKPTNERSRFFLRHGSQPRVCILCAARKTGVRYLTTRTLLLAMWGSTVCDIYHRHENCAIIFSNITLFSLYYVCRNYNKSSDYFIKKGKTKLIYIKISRKIQNEF